MRLAARALNLLREAVHYRRAAFTAGLTAAGLQVVPTLRDPTRGDVLLVWNRYGGYAETADAFERAGARVIVAENCPVGNSWRPGGPWVSLALRYPAVCMGDMRPDGPERWDEWGVELAPWRSGSEVVVLGQRGIGHPAVRSPAGWEICAARAVGGRIRQHPGTSSAAPGLLDDLARARAVVTWASGAAAQAMMAGIPVYAEHPGFALREACGVLSDWPIPAPTDDAARLRAFQQLAWGMWTIDEVTTGEPLARLLQ